MTAGAAAPAQASPNPTVRISISPSGGPSAMPSATNTGVNSRSGAGRSGISPDTSAHCGPLSGLVHAGGHDLSVFPVCRS
jgi:hypothetical protein